MDKEVTERFKGRIADIAVSELFDGRPEEISLDGDWKYSVSDDNTVEYAKVDIDDKNWDVMRIPSNWFLKGSKEYPGEKGLNYPGSIWFRRKFRVAEALKGKVVFLKLCMVDYFTDIFVNGYYAGSHEGYFQEFKFNVMDKLNYGGENVIAVRVNCPEFVVDFKEEYEISWPRRQRLIKGIFGYHDTRPGGTGKRGQEYSTGGIIGGVSLEVTGWSSIEDIAVSTRVLEKDTAKLEIEFIILNHLDRNKRVKLKGNIVPSNFKGDVDIPVVIKKELRPGENRIKAELEVEKPMLWWSWDYGEPNLYRIKADVVDYSGVVLDSYEDIFGIRTIKVNDMWRWYLNGVRIFPRGSNYISTQWLSQMDKEEYVRDVKMMIEANLNSIRVHAHIEKEEFYDVCDELGLMVWQDFTLQWGYADVEVVHRECRRQQKDMIEMLYNHPSIIAWCCHNEPPWVFYSWNGQKYPRQNKKLDGVLEKDVKSVDSTRFVHAASGHGDYHVYSGWYTGEPEDFYFMQSFSFINEYGTQAIPVYESTVEMFSEDALWPDTEKDWQEWAFHCFQKKETFEIAKIDMGRDIKEFIENSQRYQAALCRFATECLRRKRYNPLGGLYHFMFVEDWPSITWAVVDYNRIPKEGYYALKKAMQPVLPSIAYNISSPKNKVVIWAINDLHKDFVPAYVKWKIIDESGKLIKEDSKEINLYRDSIQKVSGVKGIKAVYEGKVTFEVWIEDREGKLLGKNNLSQRDFILR